MRLTKLVSSPRCEFLAVLILSLTALAFSGRTPASTPAIPMETVMQSVREYGKGHASSLASSPKPASALQPAVPDDPNNFDDTYKVNIFNLFALGAFPRLEQEAQTVRANKSRLIGGVWKLYMFYQGVSVPSGGNDATEAAYQAHFAFINKWIAAYPDSATARIALALSYLQYASAARGSGYAHTVSDYAWQLHARRTEMALKVLLEAAQLKERCPFWYEAMQVVAINQGWDPSQARELVTQAEAFEPSYYHFYREFANYLLPKWYGEEGDTLAYAEEISSRLGGSQGNIIYFEIASLQACQCDPNRNSLDGFSWLKVKQGYYDLKKLYGVSPLKMNRFAFMAYLVHDKATAQEVFRDLGSNWHHDVWLNPSDFESARAWAATPLP